VLVAQHGPFTWGLDAAEAVHNAVALEFIARLAAETLRLRPDAPAMPDELRDKHFFRKHGPSAYYGQTKRNKPVH
jgi:L-ribulose-5-phosphate 4-epimerase